MLTEYRYLLTKFRMDTDCLFKAHKHARTNVSYATTYSSRGRSTIS